METASTAFKAKKFAFYACALIGAGLLVYAAVAVARALLNIRAAKKLGMTLPFVGTVEHFFDNPLAGQVSLNEAASAVIAQQPPTVMRRAV